MRGVLGGATVAAIAATLLASVMLALALSASPATAFTAWQHDGATGCVCHTNGTPTDASCVTCHTGFQSYPDDTCWSCHYPGQDTRPYWTDVTPTLTPTASPTETATPTPTPTPAETSAPCSRECHLYNSVAKAYTIPYTHGTNPHLGSTPDCLDCHQTSPGIANPGSSPHHSGQATGFADCSACHSSPQKHAGEVTCTKCHKSAVDFHLYTASSAGYTKCGACHKMKHARKRVSTRKCASCHKGTSGRAAQHSAKVKKKYVCGACHKQKLHARRVSKRVKSCRTCHRGKFHAAQRTPGKSTCTKCHVVRLRHDDGYPCYLCHRRAIHNRRPGAVNH